MSIHTLKKWIARTDRRKDQAGLLANNELRLLLGNYNSGKVGHATMVDRLCKIVEELEALGYEE